MSKQSEERHNENGEEKLDPTPMQPPLGYKKTLSLSQQIQQQIRLHKLDLEDRAITETDEEADDFEVGDDYQPMSPHENDHVPPIAKLKAAAKDINARREKAIREKAVKEYQDKEAAKSVKNNASPQGEPEPSLPATARQET